MIFKSTSELKNYILLASKSAIAKTQEQVYQIINRFVKEYYSEFSPVEYERTYQLFKSLVKTNVVQTSNGWKAEVYFDLDALDYHMKRVNGREVANKGWSEEDTLYEAMIGGTHGGYVANNNTEIWTESMSVLSVQGYEIFKRMLVDSGIPIKK